MAETTFWGKVKEFWSQLSTPVKAMAVIVISAVIAIKYKDLMMTFIKWTADRLMAKTEKTDQGLAQQQQATNQEANALVEHANSLGDDPKPVGKDWYKE